jgi:transcriptional regulator with XRE-family HTH domain
MSNLSTGRTLRRLRENSGLRVSDVGDVIGRQGKTVNAWENGRGEPDIDTLVTLSKLFGVKNILAEIAFDRYGAASPLVPESSLTEDAFLSRYRSLDHFGKLAAERVVDTEAERVRLSRDAGTADVSPAVRHIDVPVCRHPFYPGNGVDEISLFDSVELIRIPDNDIYRTADFAVRVDGAGYEPRFADGDILLIRRQSELQIGEIGIFSVDGEVFLRGFGHGRLISINPGLEDIKTEQNKQIRCIGKIIAKT